MTLIKFTITKCKNLKRKYNKNNNGIIIYRIKNSLYQVYKELIQMIIPFLSQEYLQEVEFNRNLHRK